MINSFSHESRPVVVDALIRLSVDRKKELEWAALQARRHPESLFFQQLEIEARGEYAKVDKVLQEIGLVSQIRRFTYSKDWRIHEY